MKKYKYFLIFLISCTFFGCSRTNFYATGEASYYADAFHGKKTANGERFNMRALTAAHKTLDFNTKVRVTNLNNGKKIVVRINDRGPYAKGRIIDLSKAAAKKIDMIRTGHAPVRLEIIGKAQAGGTREKKYRQPKKRHKKKQNDVHAGTYNDRMKRQNPRGLGIQVGSFKDLENAKDAYNKAEKNLPGNVFIQISGSGNRKVYRVVVGEFDAKQEAAKALKKIKRRGYKGLIIKHK